MSRYSKTKKALLKNSLLFLLFLTILHSSSFSQTEDSLYYTSPDYQVAKMIFEKRVVMLGEAPHSHPTGYKGLLDILNEWLNQILNDSTKPQNLTLILEADSGYVAALEGFFASGIIDSLIEPALPLEYYEFYTNLRYFHQRIDSLNTGNNSRIHFTVRGFEEIDRNIDPSFVLKGQKDWELWFVDERDVNTSKGVIKYLKENPEEKALVFYGNAHLIDGFVNKNLGLTMLSPGECMGFWLVHYLRKEFGDQNVTTINQPIVPPGILKDTPFEKLVDISIFTRSKNVNLKWMSSDKYDFFIFRPFRFWFSRASGYSFSKVIIDKSLNTLRNLEPLLSGHIAQRLYYRALDYVWILTGKRFQNVSGIENWLDSNGFNGFDRLNSHNFDDEIYNEFYRGSKINRGFRYVLSQLGFGVEILDTNYKPDTLEWKKDIWPEAKKRIMFLNCIGINWFGYPDEKVKAKEYLVKFSGEDYQEPEKYLQWYRKKFYGYEY